VLKNLIFDFGNVLFDLDLAAIPREMRRLFGEHAESVRSQLKADQVLRRYETGHISTAELLDAFGRAAPVPVDPAEVVTAWNAILLQMPAERLQLLEQLRSRYRLFMLSNINDLHATWIDHYLHHQLGLVNPHPERQGGALLRYFDQVYYSHQIGRRKPDTSTYEWVLADAGLRPEESAFIDDLPENIAGAEAVGIRGIWHEAGTDLAARLQRLGIVGSD